jgi:hypothetical protein
MLHALRRYSPNSKVVTFYQKEEYPFLLKLKSLFEIHAEFHYPVKQDDVKQILAERC